MKILLLNQTYYPDQVATAQQLTDLGEYLTQQGHQVSVISSRRPYGTSGDLYPSREDHNGVKIQRVWSAGFAKRSFLHRLFDGLTFEIAVLWKLLFSERQDVIVSFTSPPLIGVAGWLVAMFRGSKSVQWLMDINPDAAIAVGYLSPKAPWTKALLGLLRASLVQSRYVIVLDRWMKEKVLQKGVPSDRVHVVPPWPVIDVSHTDIPATKNRFRLENELSGKFVVMYSGNHSIVHPLDTLLDAALVLKEEPKVKFAFVGNGLRALDVDRLKSKHSLKNIAQFPHQPRERVSETLCAADLHVVVLGDKVNGLVHTSKIYSILATGKPYVVIGPRKSHLGDLLDECPFGFQVENGDVDGLVGAIAKARSLSAAELREIRENNQGYVRRRANPARSFAIVGELVGGASAASQFTKAVAERASR